MSSSSQSPSPFVFSPSQIWDGNDGSWSTFILRIGTPAQTFRVLPSTAGQEIFVPVPEGCLPSDPQNCGELRGVYPFRGQQTGFQSNQSSTWKLIGLYDLVLERNLNYSGNGMYGLENVGLMVDGDVTLENQIVAGIATKDFYLGILGLGPKPSNFSDFENPQPSLMQTLRDKDMIPSLSYAYTAGAPYHIPKALGSLTLGGFDQSKFDAPSSPIPFPFSSDDSRSLSVGIQGITAFNTLEGTITLSDASNPILALIDSTVPHLWLPRSVCDKFEAALGLAYDPHTDFYLFNNSSTYDTFLRNKPSVVITLGNDNDPSKLVRITLPSAAFDLHASYPIYANSTSYFPIRRAANDSQYTLGRAFLQEAYVIADYERSSFSVHQVRDGPHEADIIAIHPPGSQQGTPPEPPPISSKRTLSTGAIVGISIGSTLAVILLAALLYMYFRKIRVVATLELRHEGEPPDSDIVHQDRDPGEEAMGEPRYEMEETRSEMAHSVDPTKPGNTQVELDSPGLYLLSDDARRHELPGSDVRSPIPAIVIH
ncbi:aspartic peptidase domain-containing protein [Massariosphaeria phaeospora]|uniref:Aspartic peptidase domain-containing protein n=1 Tax=Massariosphaeria phaeospora TaxID=100035 RepID=A0A7C8MUC0_9PLEO|nr:aspartic peptidase domain-containing protein [Massariosphaeria phaeospora]